VLLFQSLPQTLQPSEFVFLLLRNIKNSSPTPSFPPMHSADNFRLARHPAGIEREDVIVCSAAQSSIQKCIPGPRTPMKIPETTRPRANQKKLKGMGRVTSV
jgi:hypothetical protein